MKNIYNTLLHALFSLCALLCLTQAQLDFVSSKCVDPNGFDTCWSNAQNNANQCFGSNCASGQCQDQFNCASDNQDCVSACVCIAYRDWINCALSHCWNRVYSCAYQSLVVKAFMECDIATVFPPYFPAPANAPGGCSCNIGSAYVVIRDYRDLQNVCNENIDNIAPQLAYGLPLEYHNECYCCGWSGEVSSLPNICPSTDPSSISFWSDIQILAAASTAFPSCTKILAAATCTADPLGFPTPALAPNGHFYRPGSLPPPGTKAVSNNAGSLTTPIKGKVITWSLAKSALVDVATAYIPA